MLFVSQSRMRKLHQAAMLLPVVIGCYAGEPDQAQMTTTNSPGKMPVEEAFRKALGSVKGRVNLMDPKVEFGLSRMTNNAWLIQLQSAADVPTPGISIRVTDGGNIAIALASTNTTAAAWLSSGKASAPDPELRIRPEVALRQGVEALNKWWKVAPDAFFSPEGRMTLRRTGKQEWLMKVRKYPATGNPEWRVEIKENGDVDAYPVGLL